MAIDEGRIEPGGVDRSYQSAPNFLTLWSTPFAPDLRNRWLRFLLHVRFDFDSDGFVELYGDLDGRGTVVLMPRTHTPTMKRNDDGPLPSHARLGIYRHADVGGTARIWFDGYVVADMRSAAEAVRPSPGRRPAIGRPRAPTDSPAPSAPADRAPGTQCRLPSESGASAAGGCGAPSTVAWSCARAATSRAAFAPVSSSRARPREGSHRAPRRRRPGRHPRLPRGVVSARLRRGLPRDPAENAGRKSRSHEARSRRGRSRRQQTVRRRELTLR